MYICPWKHYFIFSSVWYGEREDVQSSHRALKRPSDTRFSRVIWASACIGTPLCQLDQTLKTADPCLFQSPLSLRGIELGSFRSLVTRLQVSY